MKRPRRVRQPALVPALCVAVLLSAVVKCYPKSHSSRMRVLFSDHFASDMTLNPARWSTDTPFLKTLAHNQSFLISSKWVNPTLKFSRSGMTMSGANGTYEFTGVQSTRSFNPPFTVAFAVMGVIANGNPFMFYLLTAGQREDFSISGNLNPRNSGFYGIRVSAGRGLASLFPPVLYSTPALNTWYSITISVDAAGKVYVKLTNARGTVLGRRYNVMAGHGPFYLVLAQYEGLPDSGAGPNSATWGSLEVTRSVPSDPSVFNNGP